MAVAYIMDFDGGSTADYDAVMDRMQLGDRLPEGALYHGVGATPSGLRVCDVWESAEAFEAFAQSKIGPLTAEQGMAEPKITAFECHVVRGLGGKPGFLQVVRVPGLDAAGFEALDTAVLGPERTLPEGCAYHVNGALGDGWCVLDYWTSKQLRDSFMEASVQPAMEAAGVDQPPTIEELTLHKSLTEPAQQPA